MPQKERVLLVGCGGIGAIAALNLETGGKAEVTAILRSNYETVKKNGFNFRSIDHGVVNGFRPTCGIWTFDIVEDLFD
jgi:ketopantoate reductase